MGPMKREQVRARDGDACWWCFKRMDFSAGANAKQKPTIEHLEPKSLGGGSDLDNLVLCHPGCNKQLADRSRVDKERLRARRQSRRERKISIAPIAAMTSKAKPVTVEPSAPVPDASSPVAALPVRTAPPAMTLVADWQRVAMIATATATFFAGLCLGMLVG